MPDQVVSIALCKCDAGDAEPTLFATTSPRVVVDGKQVATIADLTFMGTFGACARRGDRHCAYAPAATWTTLPVNTLFGGLPPLVKGARLRCVVGGEITILDANQLTTETGLPVTSEQVMAAGFALPPWLPGWLRDQAIDSVTYRPLCDQDINEHNPVCKEPNGSDPPDEIFERRGPPGPPPVPVPLTPYHPPRPAPVCRPARRRPARSSLWRDGGDAISSASNLSNHSRNPPPAHC